MYLLLGVIIHKPLPSREEREDGCVRKFSVLRKRMVMFISVIMGNSYTILCLCENMKLLHKSEQLYFIDFAELRGRSMRHEAFDQFGRK